MKTLSILLAIFINPFVAWFTFFIVAPVHPVMNWEWTVSLEIKVAVEILAVIIAILSIWNSTQSAHAKIMLLAELILIILGAGSIGWGVHLSEGWMIFCGSSLLMQGIAALWGLAIDHEHIVEWREIRK